MKPEPEGQRKTVLTKWALTLQGLISVGYLVVQAVTGGNIADNFIPSTSLSVSAILGLFAGGNVMEHRAKALLSGLTKKQEGK